MHFSNVFLTTELVNTSIDTIKTIVMALGGGTAIFGIIDFVQGRSHDNPQEKAKGMSAFIGGLALIYVAMKLVPKMSGFFNFK